MKIGTLELEIDRCRVDYERNKDGKMELQVDFYLNSILYYEQLKKVINTQTLSVTQRAAIIGAIPLTLLPATEDLRIKQLSFSETKDGMQSRVILHKLLD